MLHILWSLHLFISVFVYIYFLVKYVPEDIREGWKDGLPIGAKVFFEILTPFVWGVRAFLWEIFLPYFKIAKFREAVDFHFSWR